MNTTYCELTSLFLLGSGTGRIRRVPKSNLKKAIISEKARPNQKTKSNINLKSSYRPSNKSFKKQKQAEEKQKENSDEEDDYDSEEDEEDAAQRLDDMVSIQVETPAWADQVVDFVLDTLGWKHPDAEPSDDKMSTMTSDFKSEHLIALLPTLWTLLNCLETQRREWVFEAFMAYFNEAHVQSGTKRIVLQFLALVIKVCMGSSSNSAFLFLPCKAHPFTNSVL